MNCFTLSTHKFYELNNAEKTNSRIAREPVLVFPSDHFNERGFSYINDTNRMYMEVKLGGDQSLRNHTWGYPTVVQIALLGFFFRSASRPDLLASLKSFFKFWLMNNIHCQTTNLFAV